MSKFLNEVASYLYKNYKSELTNLTVIFPNRRAGLFFQKYLSELAHEPVFSPDIITISDLVGGISGLKTAEQSKLIIELYKVFRELVNNAETIDDFYYWGEMLLADFNDIDKYLVDARQLFNNIKSLREIDMGFDFLTKEQIACLSAFWVNILNARNSENKEYFMTLWEKLFSIYEKFNERLAVNGLAYEGMLYRTMANNLDKQDAGLQTKNYALVGFNALNNCEKKLFKYLSVNSNASFFWDYDEYYMGSQAHEAGLFMSENLLNFPMPEDFSFESDNFSNLSEINVVAVPGFSGQATFASKWLADNESLVSNRFDNTAVVMCDESLLMPLLNTIPSHINEFNITMGFPIKNSPVYALIKGLIDIDRNSRLNQGGIPVFYYRNVMSLLSNPLLKIQLKDYNELLLARIKKENRIYLSADDFIDQALLNKIFHLPETPFKCRFYLQEIIKTVFAFIDDDEMIVKESLYQLYLSINRIHDSLFEKNETANSIVSKRLYYQLLLRQLERLKIPFEGEPLSGVQLMGFLETRTLDFDNIVLLSFNDEKLPGKSHQHSFIPYALRRGFGLPVIEQRNAMYAYYFYRLIQRAKKVTLVYDSRTEGLSNGEVSRFATQLKYEANHIELVNNQAVFDFEPAGKKPIEVLKTDGLMLKIEDYVRTKVLSPSALNTYIDCSLKYFFKYIEGIYQEDEVLEDIDHLVFGRIAHLALEELYLPFVRRELEKADLEKIISDKKNIDRCLKKALEEEYFKNGKFNLNGRNLLVFDIIKKFVIRILKYDLSIAPFELLSLEEKFESTVELDYKGETLNIKIGGMVDRLDRVGNVLRVVDYKTGASDNNVSEINNLFVAKSARNKAAFQTMIYAKCVYSTLKPTLPLMPAVYGARKVFTSDFDPLFELKGKGRLIYQGNADEFTIGLKLLLEELINPDVPFTQTTKDQTCSYCEFNGICCR